MSTRRLLDIELGRTNWSSMRSCRGFSKDVPVAILGMMTSADPSEARRHYDNLENVVVVQGQNFQSAAPTVSAVVAGLSEESLRHSRILAMELLYQILNYGVHYSELELGNVGLMDDCKKRAREGLWIFYRELTADLWESALDILELIETDNQRLEAFRSMAGS